MKRRGVIAAVAALAARIGRGQSGSEAGIVVELQSGPISTGFGTCTWNQDNTVSCTSPKTPEPPYALEVRYGSRIVRLTAKEIMDGLEAK